MSGSCGVISVQYCKLLDGGVQKKIIARWRRHYFKAYENYKITNFGKIYRMSLLLPHFACILVWLFWMYNKTIIGFGLRMISRIIQISINVIHLSLR